MVKSEKLVKVTTVDLKTYNSMKWTVGRTKVAKDPNGGMCRRGALHAFRSLEDMRRFGYNYFNGLFPSKRKPYNGTSIVWEAEGCVVSSFASKVGVSRLKLIRPTHVLEGSTLRKITKLEAKLILGEKL